MLILLGATGFTGRLTARELARQRQPFALAGRDEARLQALAGELDGHPPVRRVDVRDPATLADAIAPGDCLINCVGPFIDRGERVVRACIDAGAHYVDTTGEQRFIRNVQERYDDAAREAGVTVAPAMAFEFALGDCAAAMAARRMATPLRSIDVIYSWQGTASSRGTRRTALRILDRRGYILERGTFQRRPQGAKRREALVSSGGPHQALLFTSGEVVTVPRHVDVQSLHGWVVVDRRAARLAPLLSPLLPATVRLLRPLLAAIVTRRPDPDPDQRAASRFTIRVELHDRTGIRRAVELRGTDPYAITAAAVVAAARAAAAPEAPRGVLAPAQLVEPRSFLASLGPLGLRIVENA